VCAYNGDSDDDDDDDDDGIDDGHAQEQELW
jgi:hypothetical protein